MNINLNIKKIEDFLLEKGFQYHKDTIKEAESGNIIEQSIFVIKDRKVIVSIGSSLDELGFVTYYDAEEKRLTEGLTAGDVAELLSEWTPL